jgi:hypothetical protein
MGKYLNFYNQCMVSGRLTGPGLCRCLDELDVAIFQPGETDDDNDWHWGYDGETGFLECPSAIEYVWSFTPMRQTIVLFLAAMNDEL